MADWHPLSVREGRTDEFPLVDGVPDHLQIPCAEWLKRSLADGLGNTDRLAGIICLRLQITGHANYLRITWLLDACERDEEVFLDVLDLAMKITDGRTSNDLGYMLKLGSSLWTINRAADGLERRVTEDEESAYNQAVESSDDAANQLHEAWSKVYGRRPDPSDAWDHVIKAVELALLPVVVPTKAKGTMADVIGQLGGQPQLFALRLSTSSATTSNIEALVQILRLIWPNPDRHGAPARRRVTSEEAQDVLHLAVLVVNWARSGALTRV